MYMLPMLLGLAAPGLGSDSIVSAVSLCAMIDRALPRTEVDDGMGKSVSESGDVARQRVTDR